MEPDADEDRAAARPFLDRMARVVVHAGPAEQARLGTGLRDADFLSLYDQQAREG